MAANLQPPSRLGKREGHHALAKSVGVAKRHDDRHDGTNTGRIPPTC